MPQEGKATFGLEENIAGALCYLLGFVTGIIFLISEDENDFVRFHAVQSIFVFLGLLVISMVVSIVLVPIPYIGWVIGRTLSSLIGLVGLILWLLLMYKAYEGEKYKLPVVGEKAERHSKKV